MYDVAKETIEYREKNNVIQRDLLQLLIQFRNTGIVNADDNIWDANLTSTTENDSIDGTLKSLTLEQCAGQLALFYLAGFDTSASAISYCLFELAKQPELMKRLQSDIDAALIKHNGNITYDMIQEITLLDLCIQGE